MGCNSVAQEIWLFCIQREIWISAAHIPGNNNIQVDRESTVFTDNKECCHRQQIDCVSPTISQAVDFFS